MKRSIKTIVSSGMLLPAIVVTVIILAAILIYRDFFDWSWRCATYVPVTNLNVINAPPEEYDDIKKINIKLTGSDLVAIEGNKKLRIINHESDFDFYDTVQILMPSVDENSMINKIYFSFENSIILDSILIVISKTAEKGQYWKQIFLSSVSITDINRFSKDPAEYRTNKNSLVNSTALGNNDTLISLAINYFNSCDTIKLDECGHNSRLFSRICEIYGTPCRVIVLQGGGVGEKGSTDRISFPQHAICEVYSSKQKRWYVIDPSYGIRFRDGNTNNFLNAVEISDRVFSNQERAIHQDSILFNKTIVGRDYYKYYENIYYDRHSSGNIWIKRLVHFFYNNGDNYVLQYSKKLHRKRNFYYYVIIKSFGYLTFLTIHFNLIILLLIRKMGKHVTIS